MATVHYEPLEGRLEAYGAGKEGLWLDKAYGLKKSGP